MEGVVNKIADLLSKPAFTLLFFILTTAVFIFHTIHYNFIVDDYYLLAITYKRNFLESMEYLYLYVNGRWFSNALASFVFGTLGCKVHLYWYVQLLQFILFILSVSFFFRSILKTNFKQGLHIGTFFSCLLYWFCFDARVEVFYWEASCLVHLVCLTCMFLLYGVILHPAFSKTTKFILTILLGLLIGGLSETFALACMLISAYLLSRNGTNSLHITAIIFIGISLAVDYFCPGTEIRIHNQPPAELSLGIKNTIYSFWLQLNRFKYLPFKIGGLLLFFPLAKIITGYSVINFKFSFFDYVVIGIIILQNTFIPAYLTSFEAADRIFILNWILVLLLLLNFFLKKSRIISS